MALVTIVRQQYEYQQYLLKLYSEFDKFGLTHKKIWLLLSKKTNLEAVGIICEYLGIDTAIWGIKVITRSVLLDSSIKFNEQLIFLPEILPKAQLAKQYCNIQVIEGLWFKIDFELGKYTDKRYQPMQRGHMNASFKVVFIARHTQTNVHMNVFHTGRITMNGVSNEYNEFEGLQIIKTLFISDNVTQVPALLLGIDPIDPIAQCASVDAPRGQHLRCSGSQSDRCPATELQLKITMRSVSLENFCGYFRTKIDLDSLHEQLSSTAYTWRKSSSITAKIPTEKGKLMTINIYEQGSFCIYGGRFNDINVLNFLSRITKIINSQNEYSYPNLVDLIEISRKHIQAYCVEYENPQKNTHLNHQSIGKVSNARRH